MSLISVNLTLILNYQAQCGLIALRRLMLNMPPAGPATSFVDYGTNVK